jgi:hypothetical protein
VIWAGRPAAALRLGRRRRAASASPTCNHRADSADGLDGLSLRTHRRARGRSRGPRRLSWLPRAAGAEGPVRAASRTGVHLISDGAGQLIAVGRVSAAEPAFVTGRRCTPLADLLLAYPAASRTRPPAGPGLRSDRQRPELVDCEHPLREVLGGVLDSFWRSGWPTGGGPPCGSGGRRPIGALRHEKAPRPRVTRHSEWAARKESCGRKGRV